MASETGISYSDAPSARVSLPYGTAVDLVVAILRDVESPLDPVEVAGWTPVCVARPQYEATPEVVVPVVIDPDTGNVTVSVAANSFPHPGTWPFALAVETAPNTYFYAVKGVFVLDRTTAP